MYINPAKILKYGESDFAEESMSSELNYPNSPLNEALIEFRVKYKDDYVNHVTNFSTAIKHCYPNSQQIPQTRFHLEVKKGGGKPQVSDVPTNAPLCRYTSSDGKNVVQVTDIGLVISRLKPYDGWSNFLKTIKEVSEIYFRCFPIQQINRVGLRYINKIESNLLNFESDYKVFPSISSGDYAFQIQNSGLQVQLINPEMELMAIVGQNVTPRKKGDVDIVEVTLDIDVIKNESLEPKFSSIEPYLEPMRKFKNDIFQSNLSDELKGTFA